MNIARRDKRRTNDERNGGGKKRSREWDQERKNEKELGGVRGRYRESACKGYGERIPSSLLGMRDGQSALYTPHPSSRPSKDMYRRPCAWIVPCRIARLEYLKPGGIIQYGDLNPLCPRVCLENISVRGPAVSQHQDRHDFSLLLSLYLSREEGVTTALATEDTSKSQKRVLGQHLAFSLFCFLLQPLYRVSFGSRFNYFITANSFIKYNTHTHTHFPRLSFFNSRNLDRISFVAVYTYK